MDVLNADALALMRARARHRLIGAVLLVLLLVIGVPFLLDQPVLDVPAPLPATLPGAALPTVTPPPTQLALGDGSAPLSSQSALNTNPVPPLPMATTPTVAAPGPAAALPEVPAKLPPAAPPVPPPTAAGAPVPAAPVPAATPKPPVAAAAAVVPPLATGPASAPAPTPTPKLPAVKDAEHPVLLLGARDHDDAHVAPRTGPAALAPAAAAGHPPVRGWFVQYGVFLEAARAEALAARLSEHGILVSSELLHGPRGQFTRLRSGPFNNRPSADTVLARAHALGENAILVHQ